MPLHSPVSIEANKRALRSLLIESQKHNLRDSEICYLLKIDRRMVTKWRQNERLCPENAALELRAIFEIRSPYFIKNEIDAERARQLIKRPTN